MVKISRLAIGGAMSLVLLVAGFAGAVSIPTIKAGEDVGQYVTRTKGTLDYTLYKQIVGAANAFKEGDETIGVAADNELSRENARKLLANTQISFIHDSVMFEDGVQKLIWETIDLAQYQQVKGWTIGELKTFLLSSDEAAIKSIMYGLDSDAIGCVVKLMSNQELIAFGQKVFIALPGSNLGAKGYLGARVQPNSPTDDPLDIKWQVLNAWAFAVGDQLLGTNPVDSTEESVLKVELQLKDMLTTFGLEKDMPWCVLVHIDVQAAIEKSHPGSTALWFQSLAGTESANKTFGLTVQGMVDYAKGRKGKYGLYFETGQGADFTNGHGHGFDMVVHESRKYGFARALAQYVAAGQTDGQGAWVHLNDVAGFIGPEVFKTREQLVRCCLEDIAMGKLHGLNLGLDICSTLHMPVTLDDLAWCQDQIAPANPAYLMALPTRNDPMLSYLTTQYQDHVRLREQFDFKVNDPIWDFFKKIQVIDADGKPTKYFGDIKWVYYQFQLAKGDTRSQQAIYAEAQTEIDTVLSHGVDLAMGYGENIWDLNPELDKEVHAVYDDAKVSLWTEMSEDFIASIPNAVSIKTTVHDREDYISAPSKGEILSKEAVATLGKLRNSWGNNSPDVVFAISDGLNSKAVMDEGHLTPYLQEMRKLLKAAGFSVAKENIVITGGRVRAGYQVGENIFTNCGEAGMVVHIIGERPGSGHHAFSAYIANGGQNVWCKAGTMDHDSVKVVSGISDTGLNPKDAARETVALMKKM
ncbi:MAG: ethanolamine ammonia-lyase [Desulfuromonadales bacterium C00003068]|nr:MAG: ethanolamine ammonia-lyase [Desulfuromonadales bacterium C00003068]